MTLGEQRRKVPIPSNIHQSVLVQGAMENFGHENTTTTKEISSTNTNSKQKNTSLSLGMSRHH